jgi:hypothetical protein
VTPEPRIPGPPDSRIPVFVNEHRVEVPAGGTAAGAVALHDAALAGKVAAGEAYITDGRGIRIAPDQPAHAGAILRVVVSSRRNKDEADAHP